MRGRRASVAFDAGSKGGDVTFVIEGVSITFLAVVLLGATLLVLWPFLGSVRVERVSGVIGGGGRGGGGFGQGGVIYR